MFFSESKNYFSESSLDIEATETGLTPDAAGAYRLVAESTEEWYNLREKMMRLEHVAIIREDEDLLAEGANDFFKRIADFFKKMLGKLKELWQKFTVMINNLVSNDADFVKKYEKVLRNKSLAGFEVKGHSWKDGSLGSDLKFDSLLRMAEGYLAKVQKTRTSDAVKSFRDEVDGAGFGDTVRGALLGSGKKVEGGEFGEAVRRSFMKNGEVEADTISGNSLNIGTMLETVKSASKSIESAQKEQKVIEKLLEEAAKFYDGLSGRLEAPNSDKQASSSSKRGSDTVYKHDVEGKDITDKHSSHSVNIKGRELGYREKEDGTSDGRVSMREAATISAGACRQLSTIASAGFGHLIQGIKDRRNEYRSILAKMVTYKAKASEGYDFANESAGILDNF